MNATGDRIVGAWLDALTRLSMVTPHGRYAEWGAARSIVTGARVPTLNLAVSTSSEPDARSLWSLDEAATDVARSGLPWSIVTCGQAPDETAELATRHGLTTRRHIAVMTCAENAADLHCDQHRRSSIHRVGAKFSRLYTEVLAEGFGVSGSTFGSLMDGAVLDDPAISGYLAGSGGRPVATGLGIRTGNLLGVYNISVLPSARGHGLGRAMTARILADGFADGVGLAYLHPTTASRALYTSMGFQTVQSWTAFAAE